MEKGKNIITFIRYHQQFPYQNDMMRKYQSLNIKKNIMCNNCNYRYIKNYNRHDWCPIWKLVCKLCYRKQC